MDDHFLLILADSQLPIGSFAYSSGLESASIHAKDFSVPQFLQDSLSSVTTTALPFLRAVYAAPDLACTVDDTFDANTPCVVARRASIAQGRALLKLLDKTFLQYTESEDIFDAVKQYHAAILPKGPSRRTNGSQQSLFKPSGHFPVVFGLVGRVLDIPLERLVATFLHSHAKAVLSAAVRLSLIGPYESTHLLANRTTRTFIDECAVRSAKLDMHDSGQSFGMIDLWQGRHELLYSRIFSA